MPPRSRSLRYAVSALAGKEDALDPGGGGKGGNRITQPVGLGADFIDAAKGGQIDGQGHAIEEWILRGAASFKGASDDGVVNGQAA